MFGLLGRASGLGFLLGFVLLGLKAAVYFSGMRLLRERGDDLRWSGFGEMVRNPRSAFQGGQTTGATTDNGNNSQTSKHLVALNDCSWGSDSASCQSGRCPADSEELLLPEPGKHLPASRLQADSGWEPETRIQNGTQGLDMPFQAVSQDAADIKVLHSHGHAQGL